MFGFSRLSTMGVVAAVSICIQLPAMAQDAPTQTLFTNVNVWDGTSDALINNASVLVEGNLIKAVSTEAIDAGNATVIDGAGRTLMPGLIDMHTHLALYRPINEVETSWDGFALGAIASESMAKFTERGYTTIRDICVGMPSLGRAIDRGIITGPRYYHGGACLSGTSGHADWDQINAPRGRKGTFERLGMASIKDRKSVV